MTEFLESAPAKPSSNLEASGRNKISPEVRLYSTSIHPYFMVIQSCQITMSLYCTFSDHTGRKVTVLAAAVELTSLSNMGYNDVANRMVEGSNELPF
jgi:hypothetical protein